MTVSKFEIYKVFICFKFTLKLHNFFIIKDFFYESTSLERFEINQKHVRLLIKYQLTFRVSLAISFADYGCQILGESLNIKLKQYWTIFHVPVANE